MSKNSKPQTTTVTGVSTEKREKLYENLFEAMVLGVVYQDREGKIIDANRAAQRILGLTLDQLQNRTSMDPRWRTIHSDGSAFPGETHPAMVALKTGDIISNVVMGVFNPQKEAFVWININAIPEFLPGEKKPFRVFATFEDVTERKEAEEKLRESEEKFRSIVEQVNDGIALTDTQGNIIEWNRAQEEISGLKREEVLGLPSWEIQFRLASGELDQTHKEHIVASFQEFLRTGQAPWANRLFEREIQRPDGSRCFTQEMAFSIRRKNGFMAGSVTRDITERLQADEATNLVRIRYTSLFEQTHDAVFILDLDGHHLAVNQRAATMLGYSTVEILHLSFSDLSAQLPESQQVLERLVSGEEVGLYERIFRKKDGSLFPVEVNVELVSDADGKPLYIQSAVRDITDRKRAEEELRQSEASLKFSQQVAHVGNWTWDTANNKVTWSDEMYRIFGLDPETFDGDLDKIVMQSIHPDDREKVIESNNAVLTEQKPAPLEYRVIWPDGSVHTVWAVPGAKVVDADGKIIQLSGIVQDITERKQVEQALRESEEKMRSIFRVAPTGIGVVSNRILLDANERICEMMGYAKEELIGQSARILYPTQEEFEYVGKEKYQQIAQKGTGTVETLWQRKDGSIINILLASTPIDQTDLSKGFTFTALDITERKQTEDAMRAIAGVSRDISATLELNVVLERIAFYAKNLLNAITSAVYLFEPTTSMLQAVTAIGIDADEIKSDPIQPGEGILGNIALQKWGEIVNDTLGDPRGIEIKGTETTPNEHLMGVPVLLKERLTGLIAVWRVGEAQDFKPSDLDFLNSLAQQVAVAIENARLFEETQRRLREMEAIAQVGAALSQNSELESLLEEVLEASIHAIPPAERGSILLADEDGTLHIRAVWGYTDPRVRNYRFSPGSGYSTIAFREKRSIVVSDVRADGTFRYDGDISEMLTGGSAIAAPLIVQQRAIGVIAIDTPKQTNAFKQDDLQLLTAIAASAGLAIDNARLFEETRRRLSDLESLHAVSSALRTAQTIDEALPILLTQLMNLLDVQGATLEVLDRGRGEIVTQLAVGAWAPVTGLRTPRNAGISGRVIATGQTYSSSDVVGEGLSFRPGLFAGLNCVACVPVISQHEPIGALWIGRENRIKEDEIGLLAAIGEMVGNAIHRMILHEQTESQVKRLDSLRTIERTINSSLDLRVTLNILLEQVVSQLDADAAAILMLNPHTFMLEYTASKGLRGASTLGSLRLGENATSRAVLERSLCSFPDLSESHQELGRPILVANEEVLAYHAAPLIAKGQVKGILEVFHRTPYHPETEWLAFLQSLAEQAAIAIDNSELFNSLQRSNDELTLAYDNTIAGWAHALDLRERETGDHSYRVTEMTLKLAIALGVQDTELVHIRRGALLHDIGKVGIPDSILLKPEGLTEQEWEIMRMHPVYARDLLHPINYLQRAIDIPYGHHEKWDGSGYPQELSGEAIPLAARIFAIVDVWDTLLSDRPYRPAWTRGKALEYIRSQSGYYFDPRVVDVFLKLIA